MTTGRIAALLEKEYDCKPGQVHEGYGAECDSSAHAPALYRTFGCDHAAHVAAVLAEAGLGFVGEAERHKDVLFERGEKWKDRTERAEELFRDASVRLDEQRKMTDEAEARADRAEAEAHNLGHDLDRAEARLWRLAAKAGHVPGESDNNATAELVVTEALDALADLRTRVRALADEMDGPQSPLHIMSAADLLRALLDGDA